MAILKQQHLQTVSQQKASPQFLANRTFRHGAVRRASLRADERDRSVAQGAWTGRSWSRSIAITTGPNNAFLLIVGAVDPDATIAAAEKAFGGWARGEVAEAGVCRAAGAQRAAGLLRPAAEQRPVVDRARQHRRQAQRSALVRADARQHDLRRRVQLAHRPQHPRGEGLHLFAAVGADRLRRRRASTASPPTSATR